MSEFKTIYIHTFETSKGKSTLRERLNMRKHCGAYQWTPREIPLKDRKQGGIGFYQSSKGLSMGDNRVSLRLSLANDHLRDSCRNLSRIDGYYADDDQGETITPIIARLPRSRGFLAGWTMGAGMCGTLSEYIYDDVESASRAAHSIAENDAELEREAQRESLAEMEREERQAELDAQADQDAWDSEHQDVGANS